MRRRRLTVTVSGYDVELEFPPDYSDVPTCDECDRHANLWWSVGYNESRAVCFRHALEHAATDAVTEVVRWS